MNFKSLALSAVVALSTLGGVAEAATSPWLGCGFQRPGQPVRVINCRMIVHSNWIRVEWADGASDTFTVDGSTVARDSRGGLWKVTKDYYRGAEWLEFTSFSNGTVFAIREY